MNHPNIHKTQRQKKCLETEIIPLGAQEILQPVHCILTCTKNKAGFNLVFRTRGAYD